MNSSYFQFVLITFLFLSLSACITETDKSAEELANLAYVGDNVSTTTIVHELSDPDKLNPICSQGAGAAYIEHNIFMYLLDVNKKTMEIIPWLAKELPVITELESGPYALRVDYEIKEEAAWDNGTPVTGHDVDFTYKVTMNPHVDAEQNRHFIELIGKIEVDESNPKKFSLFMTDKHYATAFVTGGGIFIIPKYVYDPAGVMDNYTINQFTDEALLEEIRDKQDLRDFGNAFNSEKFQREAGFVVGCGPYAFEKWETSQRIILTKKENWWGEAYAGELSFENYAEKLQYEIINDKVTALSAMRDGGLDVMRGMRPRDFDELLMDESFNEYYFLFSPQSLSYTYIGVNMKHPILSDKLVRKAIAHCVDVEYIIATLMYGHADPINSIVHPSKPYYNDELQPYAYDLEKAAALLSEAGWEDTDSDGIRDKEINGIRTPLTLSIKYNAGNDTREKVALFLFESAKEIGINLEINVREWTVYLDECTQHDFDMYILGWVQEAVLDDPKQILHTEAYNGGSNYPGFGTAYSDRLIEEIRVEMNEEVRYAKMKELQAIVQDEVPYIFLYTPRNMSAISKRFGNAQPYVARPGYDERELILSPFKGALQ